MPDDRPEDTFLRLYKDQAYLRAVALDYAERNERLARQERYDFLLLEGLLGRIASRRGK